MSRLGWWDAAPTIPVATALAAYVDRAGPSAPATSAARHHLFADASSLAPTYGWEVTHKNYDMRNEQYGREGNHIWENDGLATMIRMK